MLPQNTYTFEYPDVLNDTQGVQRLHNKVGKEAMRQELTKHHRQRIPLHFSADNRTRYNHKPRKEGYKFYKYKKFHSRTDLVATGRTRDAMKRMYQIRIGGTASGETGLRGQLILKFPFTQTSEFQVWQKKTFGSDSSKAAYQRRVQVRAGVTIEDMRNEISKVIPEEQREIADSLGASYAKGLNKELASRPRIKKYFK